MPHSTLTTAQLLGLALAAGLAAFDALGPMPGAVALLLTVVRWRRPDRWRRFVAPAVAARIERDGAEALARDVDADISVVFADIRHFTRFSAALEPARTMAFLREFYAAVGAVADAHGGTVKDYAGDGVMVLMGAPQAVPDHAGRALRMAEAMRAAALEVVGRWSSDALPLGVGIGVASGRVTLGLLGGRARQEYAAVGRPVNRAARLCAGAGAGEIVIDARTRELAREENGALADCPRRDLTLKGFDGDVAAYVV